MLSFILRAAVAIAYTNPWSREILYWSLAVLTGGLFLLLVYWFPSLGHAARYTKTSTVSKATRFVIVSETGQRSVVPCREVAISSSELRLALPSFAESSDHKKGNQYDDGNEIETLVFEYRCLQFLLNVWYVRTW